MSLFKNIVNESLLTEMRAENDEAIIDAINKVLRVRISYWDGDKNYVAKYGESIPTVGPEKGKKERYILPVAYGLTKSGKKAVRAYQSTGSTRRGIPHWKLFLLDNIVSWTNGKRTFKDFGQTLINLGLNTNGDKGLPTLYAITPIAKGNVQVSTDRNPINANAISKNDVTPSVSSQNPNTPDSNNEFVNADSQRNTIDIKPNNNYPISKIEAPATQPITKRQLTKNNGIGSNDNFKNIIPNVGATTPALKPQVNNNNPNNNYRLKGVNGQNVKSQYDLANDKQQFDINSPERQKEYDKTKTGIDDRPVTKQQVDDEDKIQVTENFKNMMNRMNNLFK